MIEQKPSSPKGFFALTSPDKQPVWSEQGKTGLQPTKSHSLNATELKSMTVQEHYELGYRKPSSCVESPVKGSLTFALRYDFVHRVLMVHVLNCNGLHSDTDSEGMTDPYVKMYLLPERRNHCKTKIHRRTTAPEFNEMFSFDVAYDALPSRMLLFNVFDFDRFTRHDLIGNIIMRDLFERSDLFRWTEYTMQILGSNEKNDFGDILLYLSYSRIDKMLIVTVAKAYNLRPMDITGASDPYVKIEQIYQNRRLRKRRSTIKRANLNPVYHEILEFEMEESQKDDTYLLVQVIDWDRIGKDDLLGCCILGPDSPTTCGREQWEQCFEIVRQQTSQLSQLNNALLANDSNSVSSLGTDPTAVLSSPNHNNAQTSSSTNLLGNNVDGSSSGSWGQSQLRQQTATVANRRHPPHMKPSKTTSTAVKHSVVIPKPRAVGRWHSLLPEIPEEFKNYAKK